MTERLEDIAIALVASGKGILAADESSGTIAKRFESIGLASTEDSRRDYREMLFRSDEAMKNYISGVILYDETIRQKAKDGTPLVDLIRKAGAVPSHLQVLRVKQSPKVSTVCVSASTSIMVSVPALRNGAP
jgi:fructose-bisphosphate aldolase class I